jgi:putative cell wall-binding protein
VDTLSTWSRTGDYRYNTPYVFSDMFPTANAGGWNTHDYLFKPWKTTTYRSFSPPRSMANTWYKPGEEAYLDLKYPIDLSHSAAAELAFDIRADLEFEHDYLVPIASTNGTDWEVVNDVAWTGSTGGVFQTTALDLSSYIGKPKVFLALVLDADASNNLEGVYIDNFDIILTNGYGLATGTSMSTAHVSGVAALLKAQTPGRSVASMKSRIIQTVNPLGSLSGKIASGGRVNAHSALVSPQTSSKRLAGGDRYSTAAAIAREAYDPSGRKSWPGVNDIILASGEDRAAADPLSAAGLSWAYGAPLLLTSSTSVSPYTKAIAAEIVDANGFVNVHVVGGGVSVPTARITEIRSYVKSALGLSTSQANSKVKFERPAPNNDRFALATTIARRMESVAAAHPTKEIGDAVLVANGADNTKFFDALALSPIAAANGTPIVLVGYSNVPAATSSYLRSAVPQRVIVGGGPATVSGSVYNSVGGDERWYGKDRYYTATVIASKAVSRGYLTPGSVGVAAKLPDALTGGSMVGSRGGVLLITQSNMLTGTTRSWISSHAKWIDSSYVFGGTRSVYPGVQNTIDSLLK